jgi:amino acid adenylation domain-containing protein
MTRRPPPQQWPARATPGRDAPRASLHAAVRGWLEEAVARRGDAPAIESPRGTLSWAAFGQRVAETAEALVAVGIGPGDRVAVVAERSEATVVRLVATLVAGAAYVPLDPSAPAARLGALLDGVRPRVVIGQTEALAALHQAAGGCPTLAAPAPVGERPFAVDDDLAYVLFTSGSTGEPKGVAMGGGPLLGLMRWQAADPWLGQPARTLQFAPFSFDVHFQEIGSTLACAGTLVLFDEATRRDPAALREAMDRARIERVFLPYAALQLIAAAGRAPVPRSLREIVCAGEPLQLTPAIRDLLARLPGVVLHNHYGPTETHVVTARTLEGDPAGWPDFPSIGKALPHAGIAIRDDTGTVTARGPAEGELLVGGDALAHGYLGRPGLTARRFLDAVPGVAGRWYATGDRVVLAADGDLRYLGRLDRQVKVDGHRIEPGEIEAALTAHPSVRQAAVDAVEVCGAGRLLVAWVVPADGAAPEASALRAFLRGRLPPYLLPARFVTIARLPMTPSGKLDRRALCLPEVPPSIASSTPEAIAPIERIGAAWRALLGLERLDADANLFELGARSVLVLHFLAAMQAAGLEGLGVGDVYDRPTVRGLAAALAARKTGTEAAEARPTRAAPVASPPDLRAGPEGGIAIVGFATRTAGADEVDGFWANLVAGREGIRRYAPHELDPSIPAVLREHPDYVPARGAIDDPARFDAAFFGVPAREAVLIDPQQRMLLELSWQALEHAGIDPQRVDGTVGVYAGTANNAYAAALRAERPEWLGGHGEFAAMLGAEKDYAATRIAHRLDLRGPAISVYTACSTGLVAVAQAWHALAAGQCDVALAGGATVLVPQEAGYVHVEGAMESADGHCRPFDAAASGTVFASGGAVVVLKRAADARRDGDTIWALIRGVGLSNDGGDKASFTAPSVAGQAAAIAEALRVGGVSPRAIGYVEAHGTGTALGDPIEIEALSRAWGAYTADTGFCTIGSVKGHLGHTIAAAGVLGLVKATLALHHERIPRTLHFERPNPRIDFARTPFRVAAADLPWPRGDVPRFAAVSAFGVGGTNAHVVIEEGPAASNPPASGAPVLLPVSARTPEDLARRLERLATHLAARPGTALEPVAATLVRGRRPMDHRIAVVARDAAAAAAALRARQRPVRAKTAPRLVWLFPGQGAQRPGMLRGLYAASEPVRHSLERMLAAMDAAHGARLRALLLEADAHDARAAAMLSATQYTQPALFATGVAMAAWLDAWGLRPDAMIGHSIGELAAACVAGVMTIEDGVRLVTARAAAMAACPPGAMLAVHATEHQVRAWLRPPLEIAGLNAPALVVLAGPVPAIDALRATLEAEGVEATRLRVSHAFHSAAMAPACAVFERAFDGVTLQAPTRPVLSCVTGRPLDAEQACDPAYWARQLRAPVRFADAVGEVIAAGETVFVEVGPGQSLRALVRQQRAVGGAPPVVAALAPEPGGGDDPLAQALAALGELWCHGIAPAWPIERDAPRAVLPGYPFQPTRFWFRDPPAARAGTPATAAGPTRTEVPMSRLAPLLERLSQLLATVSGQPAESFDPERPFVEQGLDSLSLTQAVLEIQQTFGLKLRFRQLMDELGTPAALVRWLDAHLPAERFAAPRRGDAPGEAEGAADAPGAGVVTGVLRAGGEIPAPASGPVWPASMPSAGGGAGLAPAFVQEIVRQQTMLMGQHLALLGVQGEVPPAPSPASSPTGPSTSPASACSPPATATAVSVAAADRPVPAFGASARIVRVAPATAMTPAQRAWLDAFVARYVARTGRSRSFAQANRRRMADPRVVTGFHPLWKDLVYPIVAERSWGARIRDLDGNDYIDLLSCFGANLLGYSPPQVVRALHEQLDRGLEVGPQHPLAAEVAELISSMTGMERVAFCNTGSEAVVGALRIARTVTGRWPIAVFTHSYHGLFDEVIVRAAADGRGRPAAPGVPPSAVEAVRVLDWASEAALHTLREQAHELAAIVVEPVQNKVPAVQPRAFVQALREIADAGGCALVFDEVVTGFRVRAGGAQEFYGVRADIATYGKVIGGGLPLAAIAGAPAWLDALDGGDWRYGDDSVPQAGVTYFAGTFVRHPLALAAARATLAHLQAAGPAFYQRLESRTARLVERLNEAFAARGAPVRAVHCASLWRLAWDDGQPFVALFYALARHHGVHLVEQFGHFVTEAMGEPEFDRIVEVFTGALDELMAIGLVTARPGRDAPRPRHGAGDGVRALAAAPAASRGAPLAPGQAERWLAACLDEHARAALNESLCVSLDGEVDESALEAALADVLARHEAFRLAFDTEAPRCRVDADVRPGVRRVDLSEQPDAGAALEAFCTEATRRPFDLERAPLARLSLLRLADGRRVVHLVASHLVFDGWASATWLADLGTAYRARLRGQLPQWPAPLSALAFAARQQAMWTAEPAAQDRAWWRARLAQPPARLELGDRAPPRPRRYAGDTLRAAFDAPTVAALRSRAGAARATLFQVLLACVALALRRRSGQHDFIIAVPFAGQALEGRPPVVADGVLDWPLRLDAPPGADFDAVLGNARTALMEALEHPRVTQAAVARELGILPMADRPPLSGVLFNLNPRLDPAVLAPLSATVREGRKTGLLGEVLYNFYESADGLTLDLHHGTDTVGPDRARALMAELRAVIDEVAALAATPASGPRALAAPDRRPDTDRTDTDRPDTDRPDTDRPDTDRPDDRALRLGDLVCRGLALDPEAIAVRADGGTLTCRELEARAWALARRLREAGAGPGTLVAVCLERSPEMVIALVGTVFCGAAWVPIDPETPRERIAAIGEDAVFAAIVTRGPEWRRVGDAFARSVPVFELDVATPPEPLAGDEALVGTSADPAYVIFTSGSTGRPKGAINAHLGVVNWLLWMQDTYRLAATDRVVLKTPFSFDVSLREVFWPLAVGATVVVARPGGHRDPEYLADLIREAQITLAHFVPSMLRLFLDEPQLEARCGSLARVMCSGEALPVDLVDRFFERLPRVALDNLYGPTETAVEVSAWACRPADPRRIVPIGHPVANARLYLLDDALRPVPDGAPGELYIAGRPVGLGYLARPGLTAERFLADPLHPGERMYRSGDLARRLDDGAIEYLGRADDQVKLRGQRIEPGEIEVVLGRHPSVARCVVVARAFGAGEQRLVAYVVPRGGRRPDVAAWRAHLAAALPEVMVPAHFVVIDEIPLLTSGKIDRKALPAPPEASAVAPAGAGSTAGASPAEADAGPASVADHDPVVAAIAREMAALLGRDTVAPEGHFFELGGHSLLAARLSARLGEVLGHRPGLRAVFEAPTPATLARAFAPSPTATGPAATAATAVTAATATRLDGADPAVEAAIPRRADRETAPLSLQQQRTWFLEHLTPGTEIHHVPAASRLAGELDVAAFDLAWQDVVRRQEALRTVIERTPGGERQRVLPTFDASLPPLEDLSGLPAAAREAGLAEAIERDLSAPFDLELGPLYRARLLRLGEREHAFVLVVHHIVWDGWSYDVLYAELAQAYAARRAGRAPSLPPLPIAYGDFAAWQVQTMRGALLARQLDHWVARLSPLPPPIALPTDRPRPTVMSGRGGSTQLVVGADTMGPLQALAAESGTTLSVVLLAAWSLLLHRMTGQPDLVIGTPYRGREQPGLEALIGFFVNMLPLRSRYDATLTVRGWIDRVHATLVDAIGCADVPFEALVRRLAPPREPSRSVIHQVTFSFQDVRERPLKWGDLDYTRLPTRQGGATQDLGLACVQTRDGLELVFTFNADVFDVASVDRVARRLGQVLRGLPAAATAAATAGAIPLLGDEERALLERWNATAAPRPADPLIHRMVSAQAVAAPQAVAVRAATGEALTYAALERLADRIAQALRARGVGRGALVGVCLPRTPDAVAALLGVLKAGAGYVPLDPGYPRERLAHMVRTAALEVLLGSAATESVLDALAATPLRLDGPELAAAPDRPLEADPQRDARPDDPAYVLFTSGSTGLPKGVVVPHRAVANFLQAMAVEPGLGRDDRLLALTTLSFDISVLEVFLPLVTGASLTIAGEAHLRDGHALRALLASSGTTVLQGTPATWRLLREAGWRPPAGFRGLVGGEPLPPDLAIDLVGAGLALWNLYGPTEATVWCTAWRVERPEQGIYIGRPIANLRVYVLDERHEPCPIGTVGEIWIGGDGVALGYLGQPELSAERFLPDPDSSEPGARRYRSGDLGRWRADGLLEHHGRIDAQVKVRGYRIELGEIEAAMATHPQVARAVVAVRDGAGGSPRLVGYVVPRDAMPDEASLRERLRRTLPDYMLPQAFVQIDAVPLAPTGKVDRKALPEPPATTSPRAQTDAPRSEVERTIAAIWCRALGLEQVGPQDAFFDIGGHSLLAMRVAAEMSRVLGVAIDVRRLMFETLGQIAASVPPRAPAGSVAAVAQANDGAMSVPPAAASGSRWLRWIGRR